MTDPTYRLILRHDVTLPAGTVVDATITEIGHLLLEPYAPAAAPEPELVTPAGWEHQPCHACQGSGHAMPADYLATCSSCSGNGGWWKHTSTGTLALWPGGPLMGRETATEEQAVMSRG